MTTVFALILMALGVLSRVLPHKDNFVLLLPVALTLYTGLRIRRPWAPLVPLLALAISDVLLVWNTQWVSSLWALDSVVKYAVLGALAWVSYKQPRLIGGNPLRWTAWALVGSLAFFVATNLAVWAAPHGYAGQPPMYPRTWAGLVTCFEMAWPFFKSSLLGDLLGTNLIFGLDFVACVVLQKRLRHAAKLSAPID